MTTHEFTCPVCHKSIVHIGESSTGYALDANDSKVCFECCGKQDAERLTNLSVGQKMILYYDGKNIVNWPGTLTIKPSIVWVTGYARRTTQIEFNFGGNQYKALQYGGNTQIIHIRKLK